MTSVPRTRNNIAVLQNIDTINKISKEKIAKYMQQYTANMFKIIVYWGEMQEFLEELQTIWKIFEKKNPRMASI